ncbi:Trans-aconitate 2-methyltransferase [Dyadobacter sp. CECT 9275]|uniref:Trans-aconitate 2-methyltransferase n=1 Tax=Dyadobacter helix TaxID=2822344 RepID=A0A916JIV7_9BACT|nr:class I SAM-dependent methyltransferase [Dyadobacter sp. CECT 9275]CAG5008246.1 Trans-aconitate 2-methyltransferase [Dyadobacter sp. CECT 9275]
MIDNREEYQRMFDVESKLWWYQLLHRRVLKHIRKQFAGISTVKILDAACGTGGLLMFLKQKGYQNLTGFDYSAHAVEFSKERGLDVSFGDLRKVNDFRPNETFDIISCNDALYFLTDHEIKEALTAFGKRLNPGGKVIINIHAFEAFSGTHDLAVGSSRRFSLSDFKGYTKETGFKITFTTYWPFALSIPILLVRQWQRFQIRRKNIQVSDVDSDVSYPGDIVNNILLGITAAEEKIFRSAPFGSSLFMVLEAN